MRLHLCHCINGQVTEKMGKVIRAIRTITRYGFDIFQKGIFFTPKFLYFFTSTFLLCSTKMFAFFTPIFAFLHQNVSIFRPKCLYFFTPNFFTLIFTPFFTPSFFTLIFTPNFFTLIFTPHFFTLIFTPFFTPNFFTLIFTPKF